MTLHPESTAQAIRIGKIPFTVSTLTAATTAIIAAARKSTPVSFRFANAFCVAEASTDASYANLLNSSGINYPDGAPVAWFMKRRARGERESGRVRGPSIFLQVLDQGRDENIKHFLLGSTPDTLDRLVENLTARYPGIQIAGTFAPPFGPLNDNFYSLCSNAIEKTQCQLVWVALGAPKQDFAASEITRMTGLPTAAVGAAFDFTAGTAKEAPLWMQQNGIEWAFRFVTEPRRLWRRYVFGNIRFIRSAILESNSNIAN